MRPLRRSSVISALAAGLVLAAAAHAATDRWLPFPPGLGGPWGGSVRRLASPGDPGDPSDPRWDELWAATGGGVFTSLDGGDTWEPRNGDLPTLDVTDVAVFPSTPRKVFVATGDSGVFRTVDGGATWARLGNAVPIARVAVDPGTSNHLFAARSDGTYELVESTDGGATWTPLTAWAVTSLAFAADRTLFFADQSGRAYRLETTDAAPRRITPATHPTVGWAALALPGLGGDVVVGAQDGEGLWLGRWSPGSVDAPGAGQIVATLLAPGQRYTDGPSGDVLVRFEEFDPQPIAAPVAGTVEAWNVAVGDVFQSSEVLATIGTGTGSQEVLAPEAGRLVSIVAGSGTAVAEGAPIATFNRLAGIKDATPGEVVGYPVGLDTPVAAGEPLVTVNHWVWTRAVEFPWGFDDDGNWVYNPDFLEVDAVAADPLDPDRILYHVNDPGAGTATALYASPDLGTTATALALPEAGLETNHLFASPAGEWIATQKAGAFRRRNRAGAFALASRGLASLVALDAAPAGAGMGGIAVAGGGAGPGSGGLHLWDAGRADWARVAPGPGDPIVYPPAEGVPTLGMFPPASNELVAYGGSGMWLGVSGQGLYRSADGGATWEFRAVGMGHGARKAVGSLAVSPAQPQVMVAGTGGGVYVAADGGAVWTAAPDLPSTIDWRVAWDPRDSRGFFAGGRGAAGGLFAHTADGGSTWDLLVDGTAPFGGSAGFILALAVSAEVDGHLFAGTRFAGLYESADGGVNWLHVGVDAGTGFPATGQIGAVALAPGSGDRWAAAAASERVYVTADGGATWAETPAGLPAPGGVPVPVNDLAFYPGSPRLLAALHGRGLWYLDLEAVAEPVATLAGAPAGLTNRTDATLTVGGADVVAYRVQLDGGGYAAPAAVTEPIVLAGLADGGHTVEVLGRDRLGNEQSAAAATAASWTVDATAPAASVSAAPASPTNQTAATFAVSGPADLVGYRYQVDGGELAGPYAVTQLIDLMGLADGSHTLRVVGRDALGNEQPLAEAAVAIWIVDTEPPVAVLAGAPAGATNRVTASIAVGGVDVVSYRWRLDGGGWSAPTAVADPIELAGLPDGPHEVEVVGTDAAGNEQPPAASSVASWTVDTAPPTAQLTGAPAGSTTAADLDVTVGGADVVSYRWRLDGGGWSGTVDAAQPVAATGLAPGAHTLEVLGTDAAGNEQSVPTSATWTVLPVAVLSGVPADPTSQSGATITVGGTGVVTYRYQLNGAGYSAPEAVAQPITLSGLSDGTYLVEVVGRDGAGGEQPSAEASAARWTVDTVPPVAELTGVPQGTTTADGVSITVGGAGVVRYRYRLDAGAYGPPVDVARPIEVSALAAGEHRVEVLGRDAAGNEQPVPTAAAWTVVKPASGGGGGGGGGGCFLTSLGR